MEIDIKQRFGKRRPQPQVCYPLPVPDNECELWGYYIENTNYYNIVSYHELTDNPLGAPPKRLGRWTVTKPSADETNELIGYLRDNKVVFTIDREEAETIPVSLKIDIFSRNTGILESEIMIEKGAMIIGCGSVGSLVALELARAGVGRFYLIDGDIFGYHNICRHQCGVQDVGKYKTDALRERILQINPTAEIICSNHLIQEVNINSLVSFLSKDGIVVGCADNREGDLYACLKIAKPASVPFISIGCWERAFAGEIFYCLADGMPDYSDFMQILGDVSGRVNANTHIYMGEVGSFEPGISADINFVTTIGVKIILDLLNRNNDKYTKRVLDSLTQYTLICNTNNPAIGGDMAEIFSEPLQITRSITLDVSEEDNVKPEQSVTQE